MGSEKVQPKQAKTEMVNAKAFTKSTKKFALNSRSAKSWGKKNNSNQQQMANNKRLKWPITNCCKCSLQRAERNKKRKKPKNRQRKSFFLIVFLVLYFILFAGCLGVDLNLFDA